MMTPHPGNISSLMLYSNREYACSDTRIGYISAQFVLIAIILSFISNYYNYHIDSADAE